MVRRGSSRVEFARRSTAKPGDALNEAALEADRQKILDYYAGKGFSEADVRYTVEQNERLGTARVIFDINEGDKVRIRSVEFEGNTALSDREIRRVIQSKPKGLLNFFSKAGRLSSDALDADIVAIRELYQSKGYIDVEVGPAQMTREDGRVDITFPIREGGQYRVGTVTYAGTQVFGQDELTRNLKIKTGEIYSPQAVRSDIKAISDLYGSRGYVDFPAGADTSPGAAGVVDVAFRVDEGVQSYVEHINISGQHPHQGQGHPPRNRGRAGRHLQHGARGCEQAAAA